jgi:hypothetical protein
MSLPTTIAPITFTRGAPGAYEAHVTDVTTVDYAEGVYVRVFRNCDKRDGCFPWVVLISESAGFPLAGTDRLEQVKSLARAKEIAACLVYKIRTGATR